MDKGARAALAENLVGTLKTHTFYAKKNSSNAPGPARLDPEMIPLLKDRNPEALANALSARSSLTVHFDGEQMSLPVPAGSADFVRRIDGERTLREIQAELSLTWPNFRCRFAPVYKMLNGLNLLWLKSS
jgi:hypothetical protein